MDKLLNLYVDNTKVHVNLTWYLYYSCYNNYYRLGHKGGLSMDSQNTKLTWKRNSSGTIMQGRVVWKPVNANPGLKVDWSINFS